MPKSASPFRDHTVPKVAKRLGLPEHLLRRGARAGDVKLETWAGLDWIAPAEEARMAAILDKVRAFPAGPELTAELLHAAPETPAPGLAQPISAKSEARRSRARSRKREIHTEHQV